MKRALTVILMIVLIVTFAPGAHAASAAEEKNNKPHDGIVSLFDSQFAPKEKEKLITLDITLSESVILKIYEVMPFSYSGKTFADRIAAAIDSYNRSDPGEIPYLILSDDSSRRIVYNPNYGSIHVRDSYRNTPLPQYIQDIIALEPQVEINGVKETVTGVYIFQHRSSYNEILVCISTEGECLLKLYHKKDGPATVLSEADYETYASDYSKYLKSVAWVPLDKFIEEHDYYMDTAELRLAKERPAKIKATVTRVLIISAIVLLAAGALYLGYKIYKERKIRKLALTWKTKGILIALCACAILLYCVFGLPVTLESIKYQNAKKLIAAIEAEDIKQITRLLESGVDPNQFDGRPSKESSVQKPLSVACRTGNLEIVKLMLKYGATVQYVENTGSSPLQATVFRYDPDDLEIVKLLLENGTDLSQKAERNAIFNVANSSQFVYERDETENPYQVKAEQDMLKIIQLLAGNADINSLLHTNGGTLLTWAALSGNVTIVEYCLAQGSVPTKISISAYTSALQNGNYCTAKLIKQSTGSFPAGLIYKYIAKTATVELSVKDVNQIRSMLNNGKWVEKDSYLEMQGYVELDGLLLKYNFETGVFFDSENNKYLELTYAQRQYMEELIE